MPGYRHSANLERGPAAGPASTRRYVLVSLALILWLGACPRPTALNPGAVVYYVSPSGNDENPGTASQPWRTIQKAADTLSAGDTVYVRAGTYQEQVRPRNSGAPGALITYSAYPGDIVTIDGAHVSLGDWDGLFHIAGKHDIRVSGLRIINAGSSVHNVGVLVDQASSITIAGCYVYHTAAAGIRIEGSTAIVIRDNEVEDACYAGYNESIAVGSTDGFDIRGNHVHHSLKAGIDVKNGSANGRIYRNHVHDTADVGIYVDAYATHTYNIEVLANIVHDVANDGLAVASEQGGLLEDVVLYNNVAYNNESTGVYVSPCCIASHPVRDVRIVNNTLYNNGRSGWGGGIMIDNPQAQGILIRNNIASRNLSFQLRLDTAFPPDQATVDHNLIDGFRGIVGEIRGNDYVEGDPLFVDAPAGNLHLQPLSPAIDRAIALSAPPTDLDGQFRPQGAAYDIGADECFLGTRVVYCPLVLNHHWSILQWYLLTEWKERTRNW
jgi:hypothetical protein